MSDLASLAKRRTLLWPILALAMYLSRRRDLRRAALRATLGMGIARALFHLPPLRDRLAEEGAVGAFVAGVGLEVPPLGAPLALGAVATQRWDRECIVEQSLALAAGAATAFATARWWPVAPRLGPVAPKVLLPGYARPTSEGGGLTIIVNVESGDGDQDPVTEDLARALPEAKIVEVDPERDGFRAALDDAVGEGAVALGVCGGDGSINTAAQVATDSQKALMVIPGGTFNHLTAALHIDTLDDAVEAVKKGEAVGIDVATIGGHAFLNTASFGSYVDLVDMRERLENRIGKWPAMLVALIRVLRRGEPVEVEVDGEKRKLWMAFIGNCRYRPSGFAPTWRKNLDDETLDFRYVSADAPGARTRLVLSVLLGRAGRSRVYGQDFVTRLHIRSLEGPLRLARDGETFEGPEEIVVEKLDKRLAVFAPHGKKP